MTRTIRWGVLGAAAIATQRMMPAMQEAPSATLFGLASRDAAKAKSVAQTFGIARCYSGYDALLADPDIDAVYVPLPNRLHCAWSLRALEAGKHVLCEKPLCMSSAEIRQLCAARERSGLRIEEAFASCNHPQWARFDALMMEGAIGRVMGAYAAMAKQFFDPADIRNNPAEGGGALFDLGAYTLDAFNRIFGRPPRQVAAAIDRDPAFGIDRLTSVLLDYGDAHGTMSVSTQAGTNAWGSHQQLSVLGAKGWLRFDFPYAHGRPTACHLELGDESTVGSFPARVFDFAPVNQYTLQVERFSKLLLGQDVPSYPIDSSLGAALTMEAIFESARSRRWVEVQAP
jgi:predicted dehydrogenase